MPYLNPKFFNSDGSLKSNVKTSPDKEELRTQLSEIVKGTEGNKNNSHGGKRHHGGENDEKTDEPTGGKRSRGELNDDDTTQTEHKPIIKPLIFRYVADRLQKHLQSRSDHVPPVPLHQTQPMHVIGDSRVRGDRRFTEDSRFTEDTRFTEDNRLAVNEQMDLTCPSDNTETNLPKCSHVFIPKKFVSGGFLVLPSLPTNFLEPAVPVAPPVHLPTQPTTPGPPINKNALSKFGKPTDKAPAKWTRLLRSGVAGGGGCSPNYGATRRVDVTAMKFGYYNPLKSTTGFDTVQRMWSTGSNMTTQTASSCGNTCPEYSSTTQPYEAVSGTVYGDMSHKISCSDGHVLGEGHVPVQDTVPSTLTSPRTGCLTGQTANISDLLSGQSGTDNSSHAIVIPRFSDPIPVCPRYSEAMTVSTGFSEPSMNPSFSEPTVIQGLSEPMDCSHSLSSLNSPVQSFNDSTITRSTDPFTVNPHQGNPSQPRLREESSTQPLFRAFGNNVNNSNDSTCLRVLFDGFHLTPPQIKQLYL